MNTFDTYDSSAFVSGRAKDCDVAVSNDLVGFYCATNEYLYYFKKSEFLAGNLSGIKIKDITGTDPAKNHRGEGDLIVTGSLGRYAHFSVGSIENSAISAVNYYISYYLPNNFAFGTRLFVDVVNHINFQSSYYWFVGILNDENYRRVYSIQRDPPSGIAMRDLVFNKTAALFYTTYISVSKGYSLTREEIDLSFIVSNQKMINIGNNCGTVMSVNSNLLLVSCPSTSSSTAGVISIYKESDLTFIKAVTSSTDLKYIGTKLHILSSTYYVSTVSDPDAYFLSFHLFKLLPVLTINLASNNLQLKE